MGILAHRASAGESGVLGSGPRTAEAGTRQGGERRVGGVGQFFAQMKMGRRGQQWEEAVSD